ncbi:MAG: tyrosine--tRNA ligase [Candidatus Colwellbacteria bacterium]|nr:tyrosine--tRNA ligase [Candidatus Colwellbacteria bacterium]
MKVITDSKRIRGLVASRFIDKIYPSPAKLEEALRSGRRLTLYHGVDPTAPDLHLGHSTNLFLMREFQKLGHRVILLVGDFTGRIGDPTDKLAARRPLTEKEVLENSRTYKRQAARILDFNSKSNPVEVKFNSRWLGKLSSENLIKLLANFTVAQTIKRDMFERRLKQGKEIYLNEFLYPLMQGYDSVAMKVDAEIGGTDQTFNMLVGRDLVRTYLKKEKFVITTPLLVNPKTGNKLMSKSEGGYVSLQDSPREMFGKVMALADEVIIPCFELCTLYPLKEIDKLKIALKKKTINPRDAKRILALEVTKIYHGAVKAQAAAREFERVFKAKEAPQKIPQIQIKRGSMSVIELIVKGGLASSKSEATRLIKQGGVRVDQKSVSNPKLIIKLPAKGIILQVGKRRFIRIKK